MRMPFFLELGSVAVATLGVAAGGARLRPATLDGWKAYAAAVEARRAVERADGRRFLALDFRPDAPITRRALAGEGTVVVRAAATGPGGARIDVPGGLVHHWLGAVRVRRVGASELLRLIERADPPAVQ